MARLTQVTVNGDTGEVLDQQSIEEMALEPGSALNGSQEQLSFAMGSQYSLADSTLKIAAIPALTITGQFAEGDRVKVLVEVEIEYVSFPPIKDRGFRVGTERRHHGVPLSATEAE